ncbi:hypothetical protein E2A64_13790 [Pseudohoeflea suaedae]|uniref:Phytase-like domain-containing protein n=1 Tax=Pseudohoeflea suaedae TaxID=877384 RepID=A0A4R5PHW9_9HYPH|nr:esterase-like activity of phytase family protein [Pseudohoeflea suaedae]TDH34815.1 hypothetical protein E2A64_13790 [Pseudohoeflea suaedae]
MSAAQAEPLRFPVKSRVIETFKVGSDETRFGPLEFMGGLELSASTDALGAMSSIAMGADGSSFLGVMDTGFWFAGRIERDADGRPQRISDFSVQPMFSRDGDVAKAKWMIDAEGLAIRGDRILVSFERDHRIDLYPAKSPGETAPVGSIPILIPASELRGNRGLETVAVAPSGTPLEGAAVTVSERSLNADGNMLAAVLDGPKKGIFFVKRDPPYDATDGDFLPDGDLILLERRFSIAGGVGMRIRRIAGESIIPGATVDGEVLLDADFGYQIDNMEGLAVSTDADGKVRLTLVSDDNHSILQRNLMLEFRLVE